MIKLKVIYADPEEKEKLIKLLEREFEIIRPKEYKKQGPLKRLYMDLKNK